MTLSVGDTVRLKSGGPLMTVDDLDVDEQVICTWFEGTTKKNGRFRIATLEPVTQKPATTSEHAQFF
jgi:uncharacterized protein YodC (DUF2158 family)